MAYISVIIAHTYYKLHLFHDIDRLWAFLVQKLNGQSASCQDHLISRPEIELPWYSQHPKSGLSGFQMVIFRTQFVSGFQMVVMTASLENFIIKIIFFMTIFFIKRSRLED
jgi:hypothetical protein